MFYIIHILAGAVIAKYFPSLWLIIILSLISHFLIDMIPHKDNIMKVKLTKNNYNIRLTKNVAVFEISGILLSILFLMFIISKSQNSLMLAGIFFSLLPDAVKIFYFTKIRNSRIFRNYMHFHSVIQTDAGWFLGILTQAVMALILIILLLK